ncbi:rab GTPase-activating protein 22-like [Curcuma longa]|uniref:rab GTPase-activating protein 22-like n=1 Tax=Curcuma longa TaxID=136217 RepID=UPI003D9EA6AD
MWVSNWVGRGIRSFIGSAKVGGWIWSGVDGEAGRWHEDVVVFGLTAMAGLALAATLVISTRRGRLRSPWSQRKRKHPLTRHQWNNFFTFDGKLRDGGIKFLKKARTAGIDPSIRPEVWPFLLGVYDLRSSRAERIVIQAQKRKIYEKLRRRCWQLLNHGDENGNEQESPFSGTLDHIVHKESGTPDRVIVEDDENSIADDTESSFSESSIEEEAGSIRISSPATRLTKIASSIGEIPKSPQRTENFTTWQRIMRLDAIRANDEWRNYNPSQAEVSRDNAVEFATCVGLKDYEHLEPCRIHHAARLVAILEAYALYDPEIGYCQGMSDLLSPILTVIEDDPEAFWCFFGFMQKARHNFRLDEVGIRRQLNIVSKIIKSKDSDLYRHLEKLQAEDCFFVYRMVVVVFRRELTLEQTLCLWEVMWADQAAIRAGIGKSAWGRIRLRAPPTDDLLLYAIAASVLQKRKLIIEKYNSMDEIYRECNSMAGQLDIWKLLDDAHDLVVSLHDKIE